MVGSIFHFGSMNILNNISGTHYIILPQLHFHCIFHLNIVASITTRSIKIRQQRIITVIPQRESALYSQLFLPSPPPHESHTHLMLLFTVPHPDFLKCSTQISATSSLPEHPINLQTHSKSPNPKLTDKPWALWPSHTRPRSEKASKTMIS